MWSPDGPAGSIHVHGASVWRRRYCEGGSGGPPAPGEVYTLTIQRVGTKLEVSNIQKQNSSTGAVDELTAGC